MTCTGQSPKLVYLHHSNHDGAVGGTVLAVKARLSVGKHHLRGEGSRAGNATPLSTSHTRMSQSDCHCTGQHIATHQVHGFVSPHFQVAVEKSVEERVAIARRGCTQRQHPQRTVHHTSHNTACHVTHVAGDRPLMSRRSRKRACSAFPSPSIPTYLSMMSRFAAFFGFFIKCLWATAHSSLGPYLAIGKAQWTHGSQPC